VVGWTEERKWGFCVGRDAEAPQKKDGRSGKEAQNSELGTAVLERGREGGGADSAVGEKVNWNCLMGAGRKTSRTQTLGMEKKKRRVM